MQIKERLKKLKRHVIESYNITLKYTKLDEDIVFEDENMNYKVKFENFHRPVDEDQYRPDRITVDTLRGLAEYECFLDALRVNDSDNPKRRIKIEYEILDAIDWAEEKFDSFCRSKIEK